MATFNRYGIPYVSTSFESAAVDGRLYIVHADDEDLDRDATLDIILDFPQSVETVITAYPVASRKAHLSLRTEMEYSGGVEIPLKSLNLDMALPIEGKALLNPVIIDEGQEFIDLPITVAGGNQRINAYPPAVPPFVLPKEGVSGVRITSLENNNEVSLVIFVTQVLST